NFQEIETPETDKTIEIRYEKNDESLAPETAAVLYRDVGSWIPFTHRSLPFVDFKQNLLLPHQISRQGPFMAKSDVNRDGLEDIIITGNSLQGTTLYLQQGDGRFVATPSQPWQPCGPIADGAVAFIDADSDGDMDLYIAKIGMQLPEGDAAYQHRFYLNDGKGNFTELKDALPPMAINSTTVTVANYNKDGKPDLYVGGRVIPGRYPVVPTSYLLKNVSTPGNIRFEYAREQRSQLLRQSGLVTTSAWSDVNGDGWPDLIVAGECMPIRLFLNNKGQLEEAPNAGFKDSDGWWCSIAVADLNGDGHPDIISGNIGLNTPMQVSVENPATIWYNDFDGNGSIDPILVHTIGKQTAPALTLDDLAEQVPVIRKQYNRYHAYAAANWDEMFTKEKRDQALKHELKYLRTCWWQNDGKGNFTRKELPDEVQFSPVQAIDVLEVSGGQQITMAGNYYPWRIQWGQMDASYGWVLLNNGKGKITCLHPRETGFWVGGDVRSMVRINGDGKGTWIIGRHNSRTLAYEQPVW
ncbi:MAG TPA: VCBS repeat-containing protein, partial [Phnomibacter sp.]|nr:VCBS repeat-containing protein [Phnomibacter sp.]